MTRRRAKAKASQKDGGAKRSRSRRGMASLPRQVWNDAKLYVLVFGIVGTFLGLLKLSWFANISIAAVSMLCVFAFRSESTLLILRGLYLQSAFYAYVYAVVFVAVVAAIGYLAFFAGKQAGYTSGVRSVLKALDLPTRPLPPPRPRFPGDVNLDEYCRSKGPYQVIAPTEFGLFVQPKGQPPKLVVPITPGLIKHYEARLGKDFLLCQGRIQHPTTNSASLQGQAFRVDEACAWQYPGQHVKAIPPRDRRYIDQWRCHLVSGSPATWP
jgi:hypothetical protein